MFCRQMSRLLLSCLLVALVDACARTVPSSRDVTKPV
uniref:Lipoprotein n=1 Tax=Steinernema glaseri TaxID=37863 RepID=A0A1I8A222_9BILA